LSWRTLNIDPAALRRDCLSVCPALKLLNLSFVPDATPAPADLGLYGGFIVLTGAASPLRVPYFGLKGNYQTLNPVSYASFGYDPSGAAF